VLIHEYTDKPIDRLNKKIIYNEDKTNCNKKYVSYKDNDLTNTCVIKSHLGSGKSTIMEKIVDENKYIVYISTRKTFTNNIIQRFKNITSYESIKEYTINIQKHPKIIIQIDSLNRIANIQHRNDIVYIFDEYESILTQITNNKDVYITLDNIFKSKSKIFVMDGFINSTSLKLLTQHRTIDKYIKNQYKPYKNNTIQYITSNKKTDNYNLYVSLLL
jgi:hypothetical protein